MTVSKVCQNFWRLMKTYWILKTIEVQVFQQLNWWRSIFNVPDAENLIFLSNWPKRFKIITYYFKKTRGFSYTSFSLSAVDSWGQKNHLFSFQFFSIRTCWEKTGRWKSMKQIISGYISQTNSSNWKIFEYRF